ncbi:MAG: hypothetical protein AAGG54_16890, partial [Pseudomonadota bacterium]
KAAILLVCVRDAVVVLLHSLVSAIQGSAAAVLTDARLSEAYGCTVRVGAVPQSAVPFVLPQAAARFG